MISKNDNINLDNSFFGAFFQYPGCSGKVDDIEPIIENCKLNNVKIAVAADILTLLRAPGDMGVDVVVGGTQRFGIPWFRWATCCLFCYKERL